MSTNTVEGASRTLQAPSAVCPSDIQSDRRLSAMAALMTDSVRGRGRPSDRAMPLLKPGLVPHVATFGATSGFLGMANTNYSCNVAQNSSESLKRENSSKGNKTPCKAKNC